MPKRNPLFIAAILSATLLSANFSHAELKGSYQLNKGKQTLD